MNSPATRRWTEILFHGNLFYIREQIKDESREPRSSDINYTFYCRLNDAGDVFEEQHNTGGNVFMKNGTILDRRHGADPEMEIEKFFRAWFAKYLSTSLNKGGDM
ncbi:MAG: hypothetical protein O2960_18305 [Verrucomicrobia bacterium]|nr:hypothetical protein [Verrucomicrobiota bacterium]